MSEKYEFIDAEYIANIDTSGVDAPTVVQMCGWLSVSRSGHDEWLARAMSTTTKRREDLKIKIAALFAEFDGTYGYRRIHAELVRRLMRELGLYPCQPRPYKTTTIRGEDDPATPDLVCRDFTADKPGAKLVGDITYVRTWEGWVYVATVIDCFNNEVIGYAMADHMRTELVVDALEMAARNHDLVDDCIFHSDRGTQYTSAEFAAKVKDLGMRASVGRTGIATTMPWPNRSTESLKSSMYTAGHTQLERRRWKTLLATSSCSTIDAESAKYWVTRHRTKSAPVPE